MRCICLHDRGRLRRFLRRDRARHIYEIGDLADGFWEHTTWYAVENAAHRLRQVALLYVASDLPVLIAMADDAHGSQPDEMGALLGWLRRLLPDRVYAHISHGLERTLGPAFALESHGRHERMVLAEPARLMEIDTTSVVALGPQDLAAAVELYATVPDSWFEPAMLEAGRYVGVWQANRLAAIAGTHVWSPRDGVAALGNVLTRPDMRGRGLARAACARLCLDLLPTVATLGLNVRADNRAAVALYRRLGFAAVASFEETMVRRVGSEY